MARAITVQPGTKRRSALVAAAGVAPAELLPGDQLIPIAELGDQPWMPRFRGRKVSRFVSLRWCLHGTRGVRMHSVMVGRHRCVTRAWAMTFFARLAGATDDAKPATHDDHQRAEAELDRAGLN